MKKFAIAAGVLLCLVVLVSVALEFVLDLNAYKGRIEAPLETALHRNVAIGPISHTLWKGPGATVQDVTVFKEESSDFLVHIQEIVANVKILPLFSKKLELSSILLQQPVVVLRRSLEGAWNIDDLLGVKTEASPAAPPESPEKVTEQTTPAAQTSPPASEPTSPPSPPSPSPLSQFAIDTLRMKDGKVRIIDEKVNVTTEIENIDLSVDDVALNSPIRFRLSANVAGGSPGTLEASGKFGPLPADGALKNLDLDLSATLDQIDMAYFRPYYAAQLPNTIPPVSEKLNATFQLAGNVSQTVSSTGKISVGDVNVDVAGNVEQMQTTPELDLTISSQQLPWKKLLQLLPPDIAKQIEALGLSGLGNLTIQPKGALDNLTIQGEFDLSQSSLQYQNVFTKPETAPMLLTFEIGLNALQPDALNVSSLTLTVGDFVMNASGAIANFKDPELDLRLTSNEFPLQQLLTFFPEIAAMQGEDADNPALTATGNGVLEASAKGSLADLAVQLTLNLDQSAVSYLDFFRKTGQEAGNLHVEAQVGADSVSLSQATLNLGEFQLNASGTITNFKNPVLDLVLETNVFDIETLLAHSPVTINQYLPKELTLAGPSALRVAPKGSLEELSVSGKIDMTQGSILFDEYFRKPKDIPGIVEFDATLTKEAVEIRKVQINVNDVLLDITGMVSGLQQQTMLDLSVKSNRFAVNQLLPLEGMVMNPSGTTELNVTIHSPVNRLNLASIAAANLQFTDVSFQPPQFSKPLEHVTARIELQGEQVMIPQFAATVGESALAGSAQATNIFTQPDVTFTLDAAMLNIDELLGVISQAFRPSPPSAFRFAASTQTSQTSPTSQTTSPLKAWQLSNIRASGKVAIAQGQAQNVRFSDLSAEVVMQNSQITLEPLSLRLYDGTYQGFVKVDLSEPDPRYDLHSELAHVNSNELLTDSVSLEEIVYGFIFANASLQGQGVKAEQILNTLSGNGLIKIEEGKFTTFNIWPQLAQIFQLLGSLGKAKELTRIGNELNQFPDETHFSVFEGRFELKNGTAGSSKILIEIPEQNLHLTLLLDGEFGLDLSLDFLGKIRIDPQSKYYADIEKYFRDFKQADESIELPFPVPIGGTLLKPQVNMKSLEKGLAKFATEIAKQAAQKQLENIGKDLLKDLFK